MNKSKVKELRRTTAVKYDMEVPAQKVDETDYQYYRRLAKLADQRLYRIEKYSEQDHFKGMKSNAYARAIYDIQAFGGDKRFNNMPTKTKSGEYNKNEIQQRLTAVKKFLQAPTSTKAGTIKVYEQRTKTINDKYGTNFKWQDLAKFYERGLADKLSQTVAGSDTLMVALGHIKRMGDSPEEIEAVISGVKLVSDDLVVNEYTRVLLEMGYTAKDLFD